MKSLESLEAELAVGLQQMEQHYAAALETLAPEVVTAPTGERDRRLAELQRRLAIVAKHDAALQPLRSEWLAARRRPGPRLSHVLTTQERLLKELLQRVRDCEQQLSAERSRLEPDVDAAIDRQASHQAYQRYAQR